MIRDVGTLPIQTSRLLLRKFRNRDTESCFKNWTSDINSIQWIDFDCHQSLQQTLDFILDITSTYAPNVYVYAIELRKTGEVIGSIQLVNINYYTKSCELGFVLGSAYWGQGYMTEALHGLFHFAFSTVGFHRIYALCTEDNVASQKLMSKCGMQYEGVARKSILIDTKYYDGHVYAILAEDY